MLEMHKRNLMSNLIYQLLFSCTRILPKTWMLFFNIFSLK